MKLPTHLVDFIKRRKMIEEDLETIDESYQGPIRNYPVIKELEYHDVGMVSESLTLSGPSKKVIAQLKDNIDGIQEIYTRKLGCHPSYIRPSENKAILIEISKDKFNSQKKSIEKILDFWGFYINCFDEENVIPICVIYPKFQAEFLLDNERYLVHVTSSPLLAKITKNGLVPYSKISKLKNVFTYTHNKDVLALYEKLPKSWSHYTHPDKVHFFIGSKVKKYLTTNYLKKFFGTLGSEISILVVDVSKIPKDLSFCEDPNSTSTNEVITVYTFENISPESIFYIDNLNSDMDDSEISKHLQNLYSILS